MSEVIVVLSVAAAWAIGVCPPDEDVSSVMRDAGSTVVEKPPAYVSSRPCTVRSPGAPVNPATGTNRTFESAAMTSAAEPDTPPTLDQLAPAFEENCQLPSVS